MSVRRWSSAVLLLPCLFLNPAYSQSDRAAGHWLAHEDGLSSVIELYIREERLYGRIVSKHDREGKPIRETCRACAGPMRGKPIEQIEFLYGLRQQGDAWVDGHVIDLRAGPTQGVVASAELQVEGDVAILQAYLGLRALGQTRRWTRMRSPDSGANVEAMRKAGPNP